MNHQDVVEAVKSDLEARGTKLGGPCGAFAIVKRVAWRLRGEGFGVLQKQGGFGCEENGKLYSVDCVMLPDGTHFDILSDGGGENRPQWNLVVLEGTNEPFKRPEMFRPAIDPGDEVPDGPVHPDPGRDTIPARPDAVVAAVERNTAAIERSTAAIIAAVEKNTATLVSLRQGFEALTTQAIPLRLAAVAGRSEPENR